MYLLRLSFCLCAILASCSSYHGSKSHEEKAGKTKKMAAGGLPDLSTDSIFNTSRYYGSSFAKYQFQKFKILNSNVRNRLGLGHNPDTQYVLFGQFNRDFIASSIARERLYLVGERRVVIEQKLQTQKEFYDILFLLESNDGPPGSRKQIRQYSVRQLNSLPRQSPQRGLKEFLLVVKDFNGDDLDDFFFGFAQSRRDKKFQYYLYVFDPQKAGAPTAIVRPWISFTDAERQANIDKYYSPFMREINADIYPAFIAEIELDLNYKINIDLSLLADVLVRDQVYDSRGMVLNKRGIPHLDTSPILLPMRHKSGQYMIHSVQQVRNRYGQIGILVCNWLFRPEIKQEVKPNDPNRENLENLKGRWIPEKSSIEFLTKPRI